MASLKFKVTRKPAVLVAPALPTPKEFLYLSNIDDQATLRFYVPAVQFYRFSSSKNGEDPARVIREGLTKVLVFYYPFAGRVRDAPAGNKLMVDCTGEGVLFVEADADIALDDFGELVPPFPCWNDLLQEVPGSQNITNNPILLMQVTRLRCGAFILAYAYNHTVGDALGVVQFLNALAEMAKGATRPSLRPVWKREILRPRKNPAVKFPLYEFDLVEDKGVQMVPANELTLHSFFFGHEEIESLRRQVVGQGKCSAFDVLSAYLWRLRTKALQLPAEQEVRFIFTVNARTKVDPPLPEGFYGNAISFACAKTTAAELTNKPLPFAVKLINEAKTAVNEEYVRSVIDLMELKGRPHITLVGTFLVSDLAKIGFRTVDFGWGRAAYGGPAIGGVGVLPGLITFMIAHRNKSGVEGIVVPIFLPSAAMRRFQAEMSHAKESAPPFTRSYL